MADYVPSHAFTGTNGDPWSATYFENQNGSTIQSNAGRHDSPASAYSSNTSDVKASVLAGSAGNVGIYDEVLIGTINADEVLEVRLCTNGGDWVDVWFLIGSDQVWIRESIGYSGTNRATPALTMAQGDTLKYRIEKDGSTINVRAWTSGAEPGTWLATYTDATIAALTTEKIQFIVANDNDATAARFTHDNLHVYSMDSAPAPYNYVGIDCG